MTLQLSRIGLGAGTLGNLYREVSDDVARETIQAAWNEGIRYFDTAPFYGMGLSERRLGDALRGLPRDEYVLSTKVGRLLRPISKARSQYGFESPMPFEPVFDYSRDGVWRSVEDSIQRLALSRIDILYMHDIGRVTHGDGHPEMLKSAEGGLRAMEEMRAQKVVRQIGIGVNEVPVCHEILAMADIDVILLAGQSNLLQHRAAAGLFDTCAERGVAVVAAGVFASGILATGTRSGRTMYFDYGPAPESIVARVARLEDICRDFQVPLPAVALQFLLRDPRVQSVLIGMSGRSRVLENMAFARQPVPEALWEQLAAEGLIEAGRPCRWNGISPG